MNKPTLKDIQTKQNELAAMIAQFQQPATYIEIAGVTITLQPGEHYAGPVLEESGRITHHLVLMAQRPAGKLGWQAAMDWATSVGGSLPNRQEQALLYANCKPHLKPEWHWSSETHEDEASSAWLCDFIHGSQGYGHKICEGSAVAVRRIGEVK